MLCLFTVLYVERLAILVGSYRGKYLQMKLSSYRHFLKPRKPSENHQKSHPFPAGEGKIDFLDPIISSKSDDILGSKNRSKPMFFQIPYHHIMIPSYDHIMISWYPISWYHDITVWSYSDSMISWTSIWSSDNVISGSKFGPKIRKKTRKIVNFWPLSDFRENPENPIFRRFFVIFTKIPKNPKKPEKPEKRIFPPNSFFFKFWP